MIIYSKTDKGLKRQTNQDAYLAGELSSVAAFAVVCDGMGGANAGNVASETAAKVISEYIIHSYRTVMDSFEIEKMLDNAIKSANIEVFDMSKRSAELEGMGTTAVVALIQEDIAVIAHAGDSRAYLITEELTQLTRDHSVVQSLIESGKITPEDAKVHPRKNVITRALGAEENIVVDSKTVSFENGMKLLLCTDGLSGYVESADILKTVKENDEALVVDRLIELANQNSGADNITAVLIARKDK